ncbi:MAG TPA: phosphatase [Acidimicrobiia bacterium]|nr:phosphatase [Acidimicrobiia bacterium]
MTRRPKSRLPPKLPDPIRDRAPAEERPPSLGQRLKDARVSGRSNEFGREEIAALMRRVSRNDERALLGCAPFEGVALADVQAAVAAVYGWDGDGTRAAIAARCTIAGFDAALERIMEVARQGGRLAFATACPASLFAVHRALAAEAARAGGVVFDAVESATISDRGQRATRLRWIDRVAMVSDGRALLDGATARRDAAEELLFNVGAVDLVVADRAFAGVALAAGLEVVALAGLDALAFAVAQWRGMAMRVVPLAEQRPPAAYGPLLELLDASASAPTSG